MPFNNVTVLLGKLTQVAEREVLLEPRHRNFLSLYPLLKRAVCEHQFVVISPSEQAFKGSNNARVQRHIVANPDLVL